ncbi:MAG: EAL domain-containing protein [Terracidiphilus sp.]|nr:EAL domain-containing protein [Terracidiphilus sp.]MDR3775994.1 EAL domain-containing protein [Terracidiphilus sp.]
MSIATLIESAEINQLVREGGLRYLARQPILDQRGRVYGHELLYRAGPVAAFSGDGDLATRTMLDNVMIFGLEKLAGGLPAFVNCTADSLIGRLVEVLPPSATVLEVLESVEPTEALIAACEDLKKKGFRIALDDFTWQPGIEPLLELADYVKVDFVAMDVRQRRSLLQKTQGCKAVYVAEKIETQKDYKQACAEGFTLFQGYYFCRPTLLNNRKVPANCLHHMKILGQLRSDPLDINRLAQLIKLDPSLTFRLLRLANSPLCEVRQRVRSLQSALVLMGDVMLRRVLTLAIASEWTAGAQSALLRTVFVRGRFCELAADLCALDPTEQYLLGMFSLLPAMLRLPMEELVPVLPLREEIRAALNGTLNSERTLLQWIESCEHGDWTACDAAVQSCGLDPGKLLECYAEAVDWAEAALQAAI